MTPKEENGLERSVVEWIESIVFATALLIVVFVFFFRAVTVTIVIEQHNNRRLVDITATRQVDEIWNVTGATGRNHRHPIQVNSVSVSDAKNLEPARCSGNQYLIRWTFDH